MTLRYARAAGVRVEPIGDGWAAYSPRSGETMLLNDEAAAVLELLGRGAETPAAVVDALAGGADVPRAPIEAAVADAWERLVDAGLVEPRAAPPAA